MDYTVCFDRNDPNIMYIDVQLPDDFVTAESGTSLTPITQVAPFPQDMIVPNKLVKKRNCTDGIECLQNSYRGRSQLSILCLLVIIFMLLAFAILCLAYYKMKT